MEFISKLMETEYITEYKVLTDCNDPAKLISGVFTSEYSGRENLQPGSVYITSLELFCLTEDCIAEFSFKNITLILVSENDLSSLSTGFFMKYGTKYKVSVIFIKTNNSIEKISSLILMMVTQNSLNELNKIREIYNKFSYLSLKELGLDAIIECFKESMGNPVAVFDIDNKCVASTDKCLNKYFEIKNTAIRKNLYNLYYLSQSIVVEKDDLQQEITQIFFPITIHENVKAYLCVFEFERELKDMDYFTLEVAATATLIEMKKRIAMKTSEERFINNLIYDLIHNKLDNDGMLLERVKLIGLNIQEPHMVVLLEVKNSNSKYEYTNDRVFALASRKIYHQNHYSVVGQLGNSIITIWPLGEEDFQNNFSSIKDIFAAIQREVVSEFKDISIITGIGKPVDNLKIIYKSYREAKDAIVLGASLFSNNAVISFKDLGVLRLISKVEDRNSLIEIIPEQLMELKKHDEKYSTQLLETLRIYLECNGNASKAAHMLYIHYKTMLYRLEKINKICSINLENYYDRLEVEIGLKLLKALEYENV